MAMSGYGNAGRAWRTSMMFEGEVVIIVPSRHPRKGIVTFTSWNDALHWDAWTAARISACPELVYMTAAICSQCNRKVSADAFCREDREALTSRLRIIWSGAEDVEDMPGFVVCNGCRNEPDLMGTLLQYAYERDIGLDFRLQITVSQDQYRKTFSVDWQHGEYVYGRRQELARNVLHYLNVHPGDRQRASDEALPS